MTYFTNIDLPIYDLQTDFLKLVKNGVIEYNDETDQVCINSVKGKEDDYKLGRGSLYLDWDKSYYDNNKKKTIIPIRDEIYEEKDFTEICNQFKGTKFESAYKDLEKRYVLGRVRIMISKPKTCLTWHKDQNPRVHFPMKTQEGCLMIIEDEVKHLQKDQWYYTNTLKLHTAMNASTEDRIHLVATIIDHK